MSSRCASATSSAREGGRRSEGEGIVDLLGLLNPVTFLESLFDLFGFTLFAGLAILALPLLLDFPRSIFRPIAMVLAVRLGRSRWASLKGPYPSISIVIPAHNEEDRIAQAIETILEAAYPGEKEVLVVDDGSTDHTYARALPYAKEGRIQLFRRETASGSKALAVNYGLLFARGEIILTVDADTSFETDTLVNVVRPFRDPSVKAVAGNVRVGNRRNLLTRLQAFEYAVSMELGKHMQALLNTIMVIPGALGAFRRETVRQIGSLDIDTITEDFDLTLKLHKVPGRVVFASDAVAWTVAPTRLGGWIRQRLRWSRGEFDTFRKHEDLLFNRRFGAVGLLGAPDMIYIDVAILYLRVAYAIYVAVLFPFLIQSVALEDWFLYLVRVAALSALVYTVFETAGYLAAWAITPARTPLRLVLLAPVMAAFYRPLYAYVRLRAYTDSFLAREARW